MTQQDIVNRIIELLGRFDKTKGTALSAATRILVDVDLDSADTVEFLMEVDQSYGCGLVSDPGAFAHLRTIGGLAEYIFSRHLSARAAEAPGRDAGQAGCNAETP